MTQLRGTMLQSFNWYTSDQGTFWNDLAEKGKQLSEAGFTALWLPPASKGMSGTTDVGYGAYDLFDFGEFNQMGATRTKYGTRQEYEDCIHALHVHKLHVYGDVVLNHKMGADSKENVTVIQVDPFNRNNTYGDWHDRDLWTYFNFPGRAKKYSSMEWHWWHFDAAKEDGTIYKMKDKTFETHVDSENKNYDFLMGCDLDFSVDQVRGEVYYWGKWYLDNFPIDGFRIDAVKHIRSYFFKFWLDEMRAHVASSSGKSLFAVGEYWSYDLSRLLRYISDSEGSMSLFDAPLHYNFYQASKMGAAYDMGSILNGTLVKENPILAVAIVENHDTQPLQSLESLVEAWFKPLAYAIILLRDEGYPCVFEADYFGTHYIGKKNDHEYEIWMDSHRWIIDLFLKYRQSHTFGNRNDYLDHHHTIGWTFEGDAEHDSMAVLMTNYVNDFKWMKTGRPNTSYTDQTGHVPYSVTTNSDGWGRFETLGGKVSVWIEQAS